MNPPRPADIALLIPDLPGADALLPWLRRIDAARRYSNFGPLVRELEQALAQAWPEVPEVVSLSSGSAALATAIAALALPAGSTVLLPAYTFPATAAAVVGQGLRPLLADVDPEHWQLTPAIAREALRHRSLSLVLPVATFGGAVDIDAWDAFAAETGVPVLVDAAAAFGNQPLGRLCHAVFSLHATKPFGIGEGGLFVSHDRVLAARVRSLSNFGFEAGLVRHPSGNAKLSEYAAAVALCQWARWGTQRARRAAAWAGYRRFLDALPGLRRQAGFDDDALPANVVVRLPVAAGVAAAALARAGIETRCWYAPALTEHPGFAGCERDQPLPATQALIRHALGLPWHAFLTEADQARIQRALAELLHTAAPDRSAHAC